MKAVANSISVMRPLETTSRLYRACRTCSQDVETSLVMKQSHQDIIDNYHFVKSLNHESVDGEDGLEYTFVEMTDQEYDKYQKMTAASGLNKYYIIEDITDHVVCSIPITNSNPIIQLTIFNPFLERFLTVDWVLEKITAHGINSLTELEKNILNKF